MKTWSSRLMCIATGLTLVVLLALITTGGTAARWTSQTILPEAMITAGNTALTIEGPTGLDATRLYPGQTVSAPFTVRNTGTTPLELRIDSLTTPAGQTSTAQQAFIQGLTISIWSASGPTCSTTPPVTGWRGKISTTSANLQVTVGPNGQQVMCMATTLDPTTATEAQGARIDLRLTVGGIQQR